MNLCQPVFFSHPSRREILEKTIQLFWERSDIRGTVAAIWDGHDVPDVAGQNKDVTDFQALIRSSILDGMDLLFLEDDIEPCKNALQYMMNWGVGSPFMTSFYNPGYSAGGRKYGMNRGFIFSQAFKLPHAMIETMRRETFPPPHPKLTRDGIDQIVHRYLTRWDIPFFQHRSLVEHTGEVSTWDDAAKLTDPGRRSIDWPGPTVDALTFKWTGGR